MSCQRGDVFCRECALANILAQKRELKRAEKAKKLAAEEEDKRRHELAEEERERSVRDFELTQQGIKVAGPKDRAEGNSDTKEDGQPKKEMKLLEGAPKADDPDKDAEQVTTTAANGGTKRKFELAQDDMDRAAKEDRSKARKAIDDEKVRPLHI